MKVEEEHLWEDLGKLWGGVIWSGFWEKCRNLTGIKDGKGSPARAEVQGQQRERWKYQDRFRELGEGKWGSEHMDKAGKVRRGCRIKTGKKVKSKLWWASRAHHKVRSFHFILQMCSLCPANILNSGSRWLQQGIQAGVGWSLLSDCWLVLLKKREKRQPVSLHLTHCFCLPYFFFLLAIFSL